MILSFKQLRNINIGGLLLPQICKGTAHISLTLQH